MGLGERVHWVGESTHKGGWRENVQTWVGGCEGERMGDVRKMRERVLIRG